MNTSHTTPPNETKNPSVYKIKMKNSQKKGKKNSIFFSLSQYQIQEKYRISKYLHRKLMYLCGIFIYSSSRLKYLCAFVIPTNRQISYNIIIILLLEIFFFLNVYIVIISFETFLILDI